MVRGKTHRVVVAVSLAGLLAGCAGQGLGDMSRTLIGSAGGAAAGGLVASQVSSNPVAIAGGTILGLLVGGGAGQVLDQRAQTLNQRQAELAAQAVTRTAQTRVAQSWQDGPQAHGTVVPGPVLLRQGRHCQQATITSVIQGKVYSNEVCIEPGQTPGTYTIAPLASGAR